MLGQRNTTNNANRNAAYSAQIINPLVVEDFDDYIDLDPPYEEVSREVQ